MFPETEQAVWKHYINCCIEERANYISQAIRMGLVDLNISNDDIVHVATQEIIEKIGIESFESNFND